MTRINQIVKNTIFPLIIICCINGSSFANDRIHTDKASGFSISLPSDWEIVQDTVSAVKLSVDSNKKNSNGRPEANIKVVVAKLGEGISLEEYYKNSITAYASIWKVLDESTLKQIGLANKKVELLQSIGPLNTKVVKLFVQSDRTIFVVSCSAADDRFEEYRAEYERILQTFKVITE